VAGVAQMALGGALGPGFGGVAQPDIHLCFGWQAPARRDRISKESSINFFFAHGNCGFRLPRIEICWRFVHMKTQQIEGVVMTWLSPIECAFACLIFLDFFGPKNRPF